jgi:hypothetical protein
LLELELISPPQEVRLTARASNKNALKIARLPRRPLPMPIGRRRARAKPPAAFNQPPPLPAGSSRVVVPATEIVAVLVVVMPPAAILAEAGTAHVIAIARVADAQLRVKLLATEETELSVNVRVEVADGFVAPLAIVSGVLVRVKSSGAMVTEIEAVEGRSCASPL